MREKLLFTHCLILLTAPYLVSTNEVSENQRRSNLMTLKHILQHNTPQLLSQINSMLHENADSTSNSQPQHKPSLSSGSGSFSLSVQPIPMIGETNFGPGFRQPETGFYGNGAESQLILIRSLLNNLLKLIDSMIHEQPNQRLGPESYTTSNRLQYAPTQSYAGPQPPPVAPNKPLLPDFMFPQPSMSDSQGFFGGPKDSQQSRFSPPNPIMSQNDPVLQTQQQQPHQSLSSSGQPAYWSMGSNNPTSQNPWQRSNPHQQQPQQQHQQQQPILHASQIPQMRPLGPSQSNMPPQQPDFMKLNDYSGPNDVTSNKEGFLTEMLNNANKQSKMEFSPSQQAYDMKLLSSLGLVPVMGSKKGQQQQQTHQQQQQQQEQQQQHSGFPRNGASGVGDMMAQQVGGGITGSGPSRPNGGQQNALMSILG